jgi:UDP-N-acetyl-D-mannosaminouronate:lipid I N-acetyl-D-mannosaminouronosyltransferase
MKSVLINGVKTHGVESFNEIIDYGMASPCVLVAINAEKIYHATEATRQIINQNIGYPDGIGAVFALRKKGIPQKKRIPGCDLWLEIIKKHNHNKTFYFVGAKPEIIKRTIDKLHLDFPNIKILGYRDGYIKDDSEKEQLFNDIITKKPDVVFVAMGSPKQELLMMEMIKQHPALYQGLGGSFDLYVGVVKETPRFFQDNGLHWLYRALQQPYRIKRHKALFKFLYKLYLTNEY